MLLFNKLLSVLILTMMLVQGVSAQPASASATSSNVPSISQVAANAVSNTQGIPAVTVTTNANGGQEYSVTLQIVAIMTVLTLLPAFLMMMTSFTRIIIVFAILRQALGLQTTPSNQIILGLSLFLTIFIMMPVFEAVNRDALQPYMNEQMERRQHRSNH